MKKIIFLTSLLLTSNSFAGPLSDMAKAKFESDMASAIELSDMSDKEKSSAISRLPQAEKTLRDVAKAGIKSKKSCLKTKKDFMLEQQKLMKAEDLSDKKFASESLKAMGDYVATTCLDMK